MHSKSKIGLHTTYIIPLENSSLPWTLFAYSRWVTCSLHPWDVLKWGTRCPQMRTDGWSLLSVMSDWQRGVDWLLVEYCRCRLRLDLRWCRWRVGAKGLRLAWPPRSGDTSRLGLMDPVTGRDQVRAAWWQEKQDEVVYGFLVEPQNQDGAGVG
jgi:hypothetical protein